MFELIVYENCCPLPADIAVVMCKIVAPFRMTDNSYFVLHWEIDNVAAVHAAGKAESGVFNEGGFQWTVMAEEYNVYATLIHYAKFTLKCAVSHNRPWNCEANVIIRMADNETMEKFLVDESNGSWSAPLHFGWGTFNIPRFVVNDKITIEFHIHIIKSDRGEPIRDNAAKFSVANSRSDVILKIGDKKLHVSKELLSVHSPVFEAMFFSDFVEKGKNEVEMKDIIYEEFIDLLNVIYVQTLGITDRTAPHILKLADRFDMKHIVELACNHLTNSHRFDIVQKLIMADQYRLIELRDHCLNSFKSIAELTGKLKPSPEIANSSDQMKLAIFDRMWGLKLQ